MQKISKKEIDIHFTLENENLLEKNINLLEIKIEKQTIFKEENRYLNYYMKNPFEKKIFETINNKLPTNIQVYLILDKKPFLYQAKLNLSKNKKITFSFEKIEFEIKFFNINESVFNILTNNEDIFNDFYNTENKSKKKSKSNQKKIEESQKLSENKKEEDEIKRNLNINNNEKENTEISEINYINLLSKSNMKNEEISPPSTFNTSKESFKKEIFTESLPNIEKTEVKEFNNENITRGEFLKMKSELKEDFIKLESKILKLSKKKQIYVEKTKNLR